VASKAAIYVQISVPGILFSTYGSCYSRFFAGHRETRPDMYSKIGASFVHFIVCYYLTVHLKWGMHGIAISTSLHFFLRFVILYSCYKFKQ
jgi:Na+-driven multidrug efflux pump